MAYQSAQATDDIPGLAVLADPTRRVLLDLLRCKPLPVGELASQMPVSRPAVSQHLKVLKEAQLVREHRQGTRHLCGGTDEVHCKIPNPHRPPEEEKGTIAHDEQIRLN
jgi:DNA-binding transcriptional ArsR family regulator